MTDYTSEITAWYEAVQFRAPSQAEITTYNAELNNGTLTAAQVQEAIIADPYTQNVVNAVIREYQAAFGRVPDQAGLSYWVNVVGANPSALSNLSVIFANSTEFNNLYGANATTPTNVALVTSLYENVLGRTPDAAGLAYWASQPLNAAQLLQYFAQSPEFITDTTNAVTAYEQQEVGANGDTAGSEPVSGNLFQTTGPVVQTAVLTTGTDKVTAQNISGDLSQYFINGKGPTLNAGDVITGSAAASVGNTLTLTDGTATAEDVIPAGVTLTNIQNIILQTSGNAMNWDTTPFSGVLSSTVTSQGGGTDSVNAAATTNVTVNHENNALTGSVTVSGGDAVTVDGGFTITVGKDLVAGGTPAGAVSVTQTVAGSITVEGGTTVNINAVGGTITVGNTLANPVSVEGPSGAVTITEIDGGSIAVYGGTDVTITSAGGTVTVGSDSTGAVYAPTGDVSVIETAPATWSNTSNTANADVTVIGGTVANAADTGALTSEEPTGDVTIKDIATHSGAYVDVYGGVNISVTADGAAVYVGGINSGVVFAPTGTITITDTAALAYDNILNNDAGIIKAIGGTTVNITTNSGPVTVGDFNGNTGSEPTGNVTIADTATYEGSLVDSYGGADIDITAAAGGIFVGNATTATDPTGTVTITESGFNTGYEYGQEIEVYGGTNVSISTTGAAYISAGYVFNSINAPVTGTVSITNTYSGPQSAGIFVDGGTAVTITTTPDSGDIDVGDVTPALNSAGTALTNGDAYASGIVTITNDETFGTTTTYGTAATGVATDGSPSVSITGTGIFNIDDVQTTLATGGSNAGQPVGTSTLASVSLTGVESGASGSISSDALSTLTIADSALVSGVAIYDTDKASTLGVTLTNDGAITLDESGAAGNGYIGSLTVTSTGTALTTVTLDTPELTSLTLTNSNALHNEGSTLTDLTTITADGSGALYLGDLSGLSDLTSINASTATGSVSVGIDPGVTSFTGGSANDTVVIDSLTLGTGVTINGEGGTNTLYEDFGGTGAALPLGISDFSVLGVAADSSGTFDAASFNSLVVGRYNIGSASFEGIAGNVTFADVGSSSTAGAALDILDGGNHTIIYELTTPFTSGGSLSVTVGQDVTGIVPATTSVVATLDLDTGADDITGLSLSSQGKGTNQLAVGDSSLKTVTITGDGALSLTSGDSGVTSVDASGSTGNVNVVNLGLASSGATFTGGTGTLTAEGSGAYNAADVFTAGSGGGEYFAGLGGSWTGSAYGNGSETINLSATAAKVSDTIVVDPGVVATNNGAAGGINNFQVSAANSATKSDTLSIESLDPVLVLANQTTAKTINTITTNHLNADEMALTTVGTSTFSNLNYTSSNGVITFAGNGTTTLSQFTQAQLIAAAELIVTAAAEASVTDITAAFVSNGNTFVVTSDLSGDHLYDASVVELNGQSSIGGFGSTQAAGTIVTSVENVNADHIGVGTGTHTYNDTGYSFDTLAVVGTGTNTFSNLAASAVLDVNGNGSNGDVITTQIGSAGTNSLTVSFGAADASINTLTVNGDGELYINTNGNADTITSIVDPGNTLTTLNITGSGSLTISGITDTALTTIDAHTDTGFLDLTATQNSLTILGSTGGTDITANGAGDTITIGTTTSLASVVYNNTLYAGGSGDTVSVIGGHINDIYATGSGDTITVAGNSGEANIESSTNSAIGANATINFGTATVAETNAFVFAGSNATINFVNTAANAVGEVSVVGDTTGAISSGSYAQTTINGVTSGNLTLDLGENDVTSHWAGTSASNSQVNVSTATSVANALDIAANQASVLDQQFTASHTSVSNVNTATAALKLDSATGLADWFQYGGNTYVVEAVNTSTSAAAHSALGTNDIVVELTGLVNLAQVTVHGLV